MSVQGGQTAYTSQLRVLLCANCGAPIDVSVQGGGVQCRFCSARNEVVARAQLPAFAPIVRTNISEDERLRRLRAQDSVQLLPPPSIAHLFGPGAEVPAWREQEVFVAWQSARKRTATQALDAAEELLFLTQVLGNKFLHSKDWTKHRAMLESSLEAFFLPRHRSIMASDLCLGACRQGDLAGAETWLTIADPFSDDLFADSMYRSARARIAALKGDFQGVIAALGQTAADLPIHDALDCSAAVHRANAWERLGRMDLATNELRTQMAKSPQHRASIEGIVALYGLCPQSFPQVRDAVAQQSAQAAANNASGGIDKVFVPLGKVMLVGGILLTAGAVIGAIVGAVGDVAGMEWIGALGIGGGIAGVTLLIMGFVFYKIGSAVGAQAEKARRLAIHGKRAHGTIQGLQPTGMEINGVPQVVIRLRVQLEGAAPYDAELKMLIPPHQLATLTPGVSIALRVDPNNPREIAAEA